MAHGDIHADTHVFGSTRGYGTVASSRGVREDEARELESFQFGEASTADRIARLETHAVMTGRALRSGRFAISRMMPAGVDDAGRPTIEVITLLVEARDYAACVGALPQLASDARFWLDARATAASGARIAAVGAEPAPRDPQVLRLFDLWRGALRAGAIGVVSESESDAVLRLVASLDPADLLRCRWGIGLLSISTPADICSVASGVSMHGARDVLRLAQQGSWHCGSESEYAAFRAAQMPTLPSVADIEANGHTLVVAGDDGPMPAATVASPRRDARERRLMPLAIGSAVLSTAVLAVAAVMYGRREEVAPIVRGSTQETEPAVGEVVKVKDALESEIPRPASDLLDPGSNSGEQTPAPKEEPPTAPPPPIEHTFYRDVDGDGHGDPTESKKSPTSTPPDGYVADGTDLCDAERELQRPKTFYRDVDNDGKGDESSSMEACSLTAPEGFVDNMDDKCPDNPQKSSPGECGCHCDFDEMDLNGNAVSDCLEPDSNGVPNGSNPAWKPVVPGEHVELAGIAKEIRSLCEDVKISAAAPDLKACEMELSGSMEALNGIGKRLISLQSKLKGRPIPPPTQVVSQPRVAGFVVNLWSEDSVDGQNDKVLWRHWKRILDDLISISSAIETAEKRFMVVANQMPDQKRGSVNDVTREDYRQAVSRAFDRVRLKMDGKRKALIDIKRLTEEREAVNQRLGEGR
ncbi:MAG: hypothetical protein ACK5C3_10460 [bacterium]